MKENKIKLCNPNADPKDYRRSYVCSLILTQDRQFIMQYRDASFKNFPNTLTVFGGRMEIGETPVQALIRELHEELEATVKTDELILLGAFTEDETQHQDLIFGFFWHDKAGSISRCNEGEARYFKAADDVLSQPNILDGDRWMFYESHHRGFI